VSATKTSKEAVLGLRAISATRNGAGEAPVQSSGELDAQARGPAVLASGLAESALRVPAYRAPALEVVRASSRFVATEEAVWPPETLF